MGVSGGAAWPPAPPSAQAGATVGSAGFEVTLPGNDVQCRGWGEFVEFYKVSHPTPSSSPKMHLFYSPPPCAFHAT